MIQALEKVQNAPISSSETLCKVGMGIVSWNLHTSKKFIACLDKSKRLASIAGEKKIGKIQHSDIAQAP